MIEPADVERRGQSEHAIAKRMQTNQCEKILVVISANSVVDKRAVVVKFVDATPHHSAVFRSKRLEHSTCMAHVRKERIINAHHRGGADVADFVKRFVVAPRLVVG